MLLGSDARCPLAPQGVADVTMAMDTALHLAAGLGGEHVIDEGTVAMQAGGLRHALIARADLDHS